MKRISSSHLHRASTTISILSSLLFPSLPSLVSMFSLSKLLEKNTCLCLFSRSPKVPFTHSSHPFTFHPFNIPCLYILIHGSITVEATLKLISFHLSPLLLPSPLLDSHSLLFPVLYPLPLHSDRVEFSAGSTAILVLSVESSTSGEMERKNKNDETELKS
jgi:hypothetical protein